MFLSNILSYKTCIDKIISGSKVLATDVFLPCVITSYRFTTIVDISSTVFYFSNIYMFFFL